MVVIHLRPRLPAASNGSLLLAADQMGRGLIKWGGEGRLDGVRDRVYSVVFLLSQAGLKAGLPRIFCSTTRVQIANTGHLKFWAMLW